MTTTTTGLLRGATIELESAVPEMDGQRVRVVLETVEEQRLSTQQQRELWQVWVERGPEGPIEDGDGYRHSVISRGDIRWFRFEAPDKPQASAC